MPIMKQIENSSQVAALGYDPSSRVMAVQFKDKHGNPAGVVYHYADVGPDEAAKVEGADSVGRAVRSVLVSGGYEFNKIDVEAGTPDGAGGE